MSCWMSPLMAYALVVPSSPLRYLHSDIFRYPPLLPVRSRSLGQLCNI